MRNLKKKVVEKSKKKIKVNFIRKIFWVVQLKLLMKLKLKNSRKVKWNNFETNEKIKKKIPEKS